MHPLTHPGRRPLRRGAAEPERRADPARGAVEVRLQGRQVDRQDPLRRGAAARRPGARRRRSEYGFYANVNPAVDHPRWSQATERRIGEFLAAQDADVQRLRRPGREPLRGHGPRRRTTRHVATRCYEPQSALRSRRRLFVIFVASAALSRSRVADRTRIVRFVLKPLVFLRPRSGCLSRLGGAHRQPQRRPAQRRHQRNRRLDAALRLHHARDHAAAAAHRLERRHPLPADGWASSRSSTARSTS